MTDAPPLDGPRFGPASGGAPGRIVVLLHGVGADGNDLIALAPHLGQVLPDALFVAPDAPQPCDMAPFGRQWFSLQDMSPPALDRGIRETAPVLDAFLDGLLAEHGLPASALALLGFSQGSMMSLHVAPRRAEAVGAVLAYSGALVGGGALVAEARSRPPVMLIHGTDDPVVPFDAMAAAARALEAAGIPVRTEARPGLAHGIDEDGIRAGAAFLTETVTQ
ncbi:MAG: prolyl oligopeptidase family serine peptidase [Azospirillaceae bacterium]